MLELVLFRQYHSNCGALPVNGFDMQPDVHRTCRFLIQIEPQSRRLTVPLIACGCEPRLMNPRQIPFSYASASVFYPEHRPSFFQKTLNVAIAVLRILYTFHDALVDDE